MENNNCVCVNYIITILQNALNSLMSTTGSVMRNTNAPSTDSGYIGTDNLSSSGMGNGISTVGGSSLLNSGFYAILILFALLLVLTRGKRGGGIVKGSSTLKK
jgi:hypothetical protein